MASDTAQDIYKNSIKPMPAAERLCQAEKIIHDLTAQSDGNDQLPIYDWMSVRGIAKDPLVGEGTQKGVSRNRRLHQGLFQEAVRIINEHMRNLFDEKELDPDSVVPDGRVFSHLL